MRGRVGLSPRLIWGVDVPSFRGRPSDSHFPRAGPRGINPETTRKKAEAEAERLAAEIEVHNGEIATITADMEAAAVARKAEEEAYLAMHQNFTESVEAIAKAPRAWGRGAAQSDLGMSVACGDSNRSRSPQTLRLSELAQRRRRLCR